MATQQYADEWLARMQKAVNEVGLSFTVPHRKENEECITFEWPKVQTPARNLIVLIDDTGAEYIRSWGGWVHTGKCEQDDTFCLLWQWLWGGGDV